jgi:hypothetical protein
LLKEPPSRRWWNAYNSPGLGKAVHILSAFSEEKEATGNNKYTNRILSPL